MISRDELEGHARHLRVVAWLDLPVVAQRVASGIQLTGGPCVARLFCTAGLVRISIPPCATQERLSQSWSLCVYDQQQTPWPALQQEDTSMDAAEDQGFYQHRILTIVTEKGPALQQEDPSVDTAEDKEAAGLQQADQQEYPAAACPRREQLQRFLSLVTEESFSLGKWSFAELFPTVSLPGINSVEQLVAIYKGNSSLSVDELIDSIAGSHQQVGESSKPARRATMNLEENESGEFSLQDDEEEGDKCLCFSWPCSLSCFIGKTRKPRKNTRSCAQNILDICKIS
ncbi:uncharacterized protein LOC141583215 [Saimiri boliviensis]|uniref:uncharacterized protein LOC141583215 n=1 Tax=Saimiri boliviensis TaxID=27679 RepID=UPI003D76F980